MREKGVPTDILNVKISHISFEDYAHHDIYTANGAVQVILSAPEVVAYAKTHDIALNPWVSGISGGAAPAGRRPHSREKKLLRPDGSLFRRTYTPASVAEMRELHSTRIQRHSQFVSCQSFQCCANSSPRKDSSQIGLRISESSASAVDC